jgi:hypothetical protein
MKKKDREENRQKERSKKKKWLNDNRKLVIIGRIVQVCFLQFYCQMPILYPECSTFSFLSLAFSSCWQYYLYLKQFCFVHANIIFITIRFFVCFPDIQCLM